MRWSEALKLIESGIAVSRKDWPKGKSVVKAGDEVRFNEFSGAGPTFADKDATDWIEAPGNQNAAIRAFVNGRTLP